MIRIRFLLTESYSADFQKHFGRFSFSTILWITSVSVAPEEVQTVHNTKPPAQQQQQQQQQKMEPGWWYTVFFLLVNSICYVSCLWIQVQFWLVWYDITIEEEVSDPAVHDALMNVPWSYQLDFRNWLTYSCIALSQSWSKNCVKS